jgi:hypothetical protein
MSNRAIWVLLVCLAAIFADLTTFIIHLLCNLSNSYVEKQIVWENGQNS